MFRFRNIFAGFSKAALLLGFVVIGLISAASAQAQETRPRPKDQSQLTFNSISKRSQRLEKRQQQSKQLYDDGLISRVELENGEKALLTLAQKLNRFTREIAAANQPAHAPSVAVRNGGCLIVWSTGNSEIDSLIRYYGEQYGVDPYLIYCRCRRSRVSLRARRVPKERRA